MSPVRFGKCLLALLPRSKSVFSMDLFIRLEIHVGPITRIFSYLICAHCVYLGGQAAKLEIKLKTHRAGYGIAKFLIGNCWIPR